MLGSVRSETYCFAKLQYFHCFTKFSDVFLLLVRKIMSGEVWKHHNPAACRLSHSCQDSVSPVRNRGCMILSWHWKTAVKSAASSCRRFYGGFLSFLWILCMLLIFSMICEFSVFRSVWISSKTVQIACKTVCFGSSSSQSCGLTLTILQSYIDYLRLLNTQNSMPEGTERHLEAYFSSPEPRFSCLGECAGKCQRQCQYDIIIAMPEDRLAQQKNV